MDASFALAKNVANVKYEDIPSEAVEVTKRDILDTLGTALAASTLAPNCKAVVELVKEGGGKEESTIIAFGGKVTSWMAAFANGTMAHSLDYDDTHDLAIVHAGVSIVPASFAVAERRGKVNGKEFITAVALGIDLACRMGLVAPFVPQGWQGTAVFGFFGSAAASAKLLGLSEHKVQNALGIAYSQAAGNLQAVKDGSLNKRLQPGFAAKGGILSALLAEREITGPQNSLEGDFGLYKLYHRGEYDPTALTAELGRRFEVSNLSFKPYPCCRGTHTSIDATLALVREYDIQPGDVEKITVFPAPGIFQTLCKPLEKKQRPENVVDAQFSIPYTVARAVVNRRVVLTHFNPEAIKEPIVAQIAQGTNVQMASGLPEPASLVRIELKSGAVHSKRVDVAYGNPQNPITLEDLKQKFRDCASYSLRPLSTGDIEQVIEMVMELEKIDDVSHIIDLLS